MTSYDKLNEQQAAAALRRPTRRRGQQLGRTGLAELSPVESGPVGPAYEVRDLREGDEVFDFDFEVSLEGHPADTVAEGLRAADGVIEVHVEDRDVLLVRASGWDEGQLVRWLAANLQSS